LKKLESNLERSQTKDNAEFYLGKQETGEKYCKVKKLRIHKENPSLPPHGFDFTLPLHYFHCTYYSLILSRPVTEYTEHIYTKY
jgi:hypothetical protein